MAEIFFNQEMQSALDNLESKLLNSTLESIDNKKTGIQNKITDSIRDNTRKFDDFKVNHLSDYQVENKYEEYIKELKNLESDHIKKTIDSIRQVTDSVIRQAAKKSENELESSFYVLTNEIVRRQNATLYTSINENFVNRMGPFITNNYNYNARIGYAVSDIQTEIRRIINKLSQSLIEEFQTNLNGNLRYYMERVLESIKEQTKENAENIAQDQPEKNPEPKEEKASQELFVSKSDVQPFLPLAEKMGIKIEETFDGYTVRIPNSEKSFMLHKDVDESLYADDHRIEMQNLDSDGIMIFVGHNVIRATDDWYYLGTRDNLDKIELGMDFVEYQVKYAGQLQTDPLKKGVVLAQVAKNYPEFYKNMSNDATFSILEEEVAACDKANEELYKDSLGVVRLNSQNRERFFDKISILGYKGLEKNDGVYVVDRKGIEHRLNYESGYAFLEDEPTIGFNTNLFIISDNSISGPIIDYYVNDIKFTCSIDYLNMSLKGANQYFYIGYDSQNKFRCEGKNAGIPVKDPQETLGFFIRFCPEALERVKNACIEHEKVLNPAKSAVEDVESQNEEYGQATHSSNPNSSSFQTDSLIEELENDKLEEEYIGLGDDPTKEDLNNLDDESLYAELEKIKQDPNVQRYLAIAGIIEERLKAPQGPKL